MIPFHPSVELLVAKQYQQDMLDRQSSKRLSGPGGRFGAHAWITRRLKALRHLSGGSIEVPKLNTSGP